MTLVTAACKTVIVLKICFIGERLLEDFFPEKRLVHLFKNETNYVNVLPYIQLIQQEGLQYF